MSEYFKVVKTRHNCSSCGKGELFSVEADDGVCCGIEWSEECDAEEHANALNHAFQLGVMVSLSARGDGNEAG